MTKEQRKQRVLARGEKSGHSHIIVGECEISNEGGITTVTVGEDAEVFIKHLMETAYVEHGEEVWTKEHHDIKLKPGKYDFIQQQEFDPYTNVIRQARD